MTVSAPTYRNRGYRIEIVARAVWLYFRFNLSLRDVEEMLLDFGIVVSYETIRRWCRKHGLDYARRIRRKAPMKGDVRAGSGNLHSGDKWNFCLTSA
ncbi:putative transposase [Rhizobium laguerreae]|uniref:Transposase n=1 Tax=Rhizobium laguerreae TaxID=1076926 RepID=A0A1S9GLV5_9HYPH|nr:putative transposase [Rhizobium laguerreae]MBY5325599.1 IS6 family transposase [Rhizobium leguminosarum]MBY5386058.1 IS6 family transposase [Rhizobium leguminosarum]OOO46652.1 transposase [Rhizobium laguerreae]TCU15044.1 hypothetical protein EV131_12058 [Rhizobium laguerreae]